MLRVRPSDPDRAGSGRHLAGPELSRLVRPWATAEPSQPASRALGPAVAVPGSTSGAGAPRQGSAWGSVPTGTVGPARILLVEDDLEMAGLVEQALWDDGYEVARAADGLTGLALARRGAFDAVVLDVLLPGLDGRDVCRTLRADGRSVPVLMLTALGEVVNRVQGLDLGADDYLAKPFSLDEFLARLRALIRRGQQQRPETLRAGPLCLDRMSGRAWCGDVEVELTAREAALLELFLRWPGMVLARDTLLAHVWGDDPGRSSNLVTQYVGHLRRKLALPYAGSDLETIHRLGYRLTVRDQG